MNCNAPSVFVVRMPPSNDIKCALLISDDLEIYVKREHFANGVAGRVHHAQSSLKSQGAFEWNADGNEAYAVKIGNHQQHQNQHATCDEFDEALLQIILFCDQRSRKIEMSARARKHGVRVPFIPKVVYFARDGGKIPHAPAALLPPLPSSRPISNSTNYIDANYIVMEPMSETMTSFFAGEFTSRLAIIRCLKQVCILLMHLQENFKFMHRDMHGANVMVKYHRPEPREKHVRVEPWEEHVRVGLIDFGRSRLETENSFGVTNKLEMGLYTAMGKFNPSLDLLYLFASLVCYNHIFNQQVPEIWTDVMLPVMRRVYDRHDDIYDRCPFIREKFEKVGGSEQQISEGTLPRKVNLHWAFQHNARTETAIFEECTPTRILTLLDGMDGTSDRKRDAARTSENIVRMRKNRWRNSPESEEEGEIKESQEVVMRSSVLDLDRRSRKLSNIN